LLAIEPNKQPASTKLPEWEWVRKLKWSLFYTLKNAGKALKAFTVKDFKQ